MLAASHSHVIAPPLPAPCRVQGLPPTSKEAQQSPGGVRRVLAAAHDMCTRFLDNKMALKGRGGKLREQGVVQGVLMLRDYYLLRPDLAPGRGAAGVT